MYYYRGLYYFKITSEKDGKIIDIETLDSYKHHESYYDGTCWDLKYQIHKLLEKYLAKFNIKSQSWQVETHTRNDGPLIDYSIRSAESHPMLTFKFDLVIAQPNGWIVRASGDGYSCRHDWDCETYLDAQEEATKIATICREHIIAYCWDPSKPLGQYLISTEMEEIDLAAAAAAAAAN